MRNKFSGNCYKCGSLVPKGEGFFERHFGTWRTQHASCAGVGDIRAGGALMDGMSDVERIKQQVIERTAKLSTSGEMTLKLPRKFGQKYLKDVWKKIDKQILGSIEDISKGTNIYED